MRRHAPPRGAGAGPVACLGATFRIAPAAIRRLRMRRVVCASIRQPEDARTAGRRRSGRHRPGGIPVGGFGQASAPAHDDRRRVLSVPRAPAASRTQGRRRVAPHSWQAPGMFCPSAAKGLGCDRHRAGGVREVWCRASGCSGVVDEERRQASGQPGTARAAAMPTMPMRCRSGPVSAPWACQVCYFGLYQKAGAALSVRRLGVLPSQHEHRPPPSADAGRSTARTHAPAPAQARFPERAISLLVPFAPGGIADITARAVAEHMSKALGQPVVVENKPSAGSIVASQAVAHAPSPTATRCC